MSVRFRLRDAAGMLQAPDSQDSKYTRGVVGLMTGSERYPGAGVLSASAALRAGAGYVRYVGPDIVARLLLQRHPEAVIGEGRADCWVIGSGLQGLGTGSRADQMRALLDPAALHDGDEDVADLLERLEPSDAVDGAAAPAIRVVDAGALVDFGALATAARQRGFGPQDVDARPGQTRAAAAPADGPSTIAPAASGHETSWAAGQAPASASAQASAEAGARQGSRSAAHGRRGQSDRVPTASPARITSAVRREGFSPFPEPRRSNPLINRAPSEPESASGQRADEKHSGLPLDPAAFWRTPAPRDEGDVAKISVADSAREDPRPGSAAATDAARPVVGRADAGTRRPSGDPALNRTHISDLQRQIDTARRAHSHPLPGVLAQNMVGVSKSEAPEAAEAGGSQAAGNADRLRPVGRQIAGGERPGMIAAVRTLDPARRSRRGTGNHELYVITPHAGELARLMSSLSDHAVTREAIEADRRKWAQRAADQLGCVVVLKGSHTFVAAPGETLLEVVAPTYWLATAGTGDVLAGTLGTVLAQLRHDIVSGRFTLQRVVALGVYLHGYAGGIASGVIPANPAHPLTAEPQGMSGQSDLVGRPLLAMDVASALPFAIHAVLDAATRMGPTGMPPRR